MNTYTRARSLSHTHLLRSNLTIRVIGIRLHGLFINELRQRLVNVAGGILRQFPLRVENHQRDLAVAEDAAKERREGAEARGGGEK